MAIYKLTLRTISRAKQGAATKSLAYCGARKVVDALSGRTFDFRKKTGVVHASLVLPPWYRGPELTHEQVWNAAELAEKRKNATVARECIAALPHELPRHAQIALFEAFCAAVTRRFGVALSAFLHEPDLKNRTEIIPGVSVGGDPRNMHTHIVISTRRMDETGKFQKKTRELDSWKTGPRLVRAIRRLWQWLVNKALRLNHIQQRVDCRSYLKQNTGLLPNEHIGDKSLRQHRSDPRRPNARIEKWFEIHRKNAELRQLQVELERLQKLKREETQARAKTFTPRIPSPIRVSSRSAVANFSKIDGEIARLDDERYVSQLQHALREWAIARKIDRSKASPFIYYELRLGEVIIKDYGAWIEFVSTSSRLIPTIKMLLQLKEWQDPACSDPGFERDLIAACRTNGQEKVHGQPPSFPGHEAHPVRAHGAPLVEGISAASSPIDRPLRPGIKRRLQ